MAKKIVAAGGLVRNDQNELLMILRKGHWDLPKGKLDEGETIEECAVREVEEETGLQQLQLGDLISVTVHHYTENNEEIEKETHWYKMRVHGNPKLIPQAEENITDIHWVSDARLHEYTATTYKNIREVIGKERKR